MPVREQLKLGASQIKLMVGGGVASLYDPLYTLQFTPAELRTAVQAAEDYGTYVATHVYNVDGIRRAVEAGVKSIEHGHLADEATVAMLAERDVWLSMQPFAEHDHTFLTQDSMDKNRQVCQGTDRVRMQKHGVKLAWGTDLLFEPHKAARQSEVMTRLGEHFTTVEALKIVTSGNAALFRLAGERDPYKSARLGEPPSVPGRRAAHRRRSHYGSHPVGRSEPQHRPDRQRRRRRQEDPSTTLYELPAVDTAATVVRSTGKGKLARHGAADKGHSVGNGAARR